jgi:putative protease
MEKRILPELLAPAGSPLALDAAIEGGADAIYVGGLAFNARINAKNFTPDELRDAIARAHAYGVKVYIAANTLIHDRELEDYLRAAEQAYLFGADALIVADLGAARELKKRIPIELHASTQLSGHNVAAAKMLSDVGFSRMVCAREMSREDIAQFCKNSPIEAEVFVHGALCVCHSGQCLFSSVVGGRSGNRGECAQPCRLPFKNEKGRDYYPLSLNDLSLATHLQELCGMGVSSLKIEGRMKSPEYVRDVTRIWRRLLDEGRDASPEDMRELAKIFSRGGFSDGYYTKTINSSMLGVRSESDKKDSSALAPFSKIERKIPIELFATIKRNMPIELEARAGDRIARATGEVPQEAINAPLSREVVERNLSKLG